MIFEIFGTFPASAFGGRSGLVSVKESGSVVISYKLKSIKIGLLVDKQYQFIIFELSQNLQILYVIKTLDLNLTINIIVKHIIM